MVQHNVTQRAMSPEVMPPAPPKNGHAEPAAVIATTPTPLDLLHMAVAQDLDIEKFKQLIELYMRWEANEARKAFAIAKNAFKAEAPQIVANATAKFPSKKDPSVIVEWDYATLDHVCNQLIACMSKHGLSHSWKTEQPEKNWIRVTCVLLHAQGHSEGHAVLEGAPDDTGSKNAVQAIGSTVAYLERYTLLAAAGIAVKGMDNNGRGAGSAAGSAASSGRSGLAGDCVNAYCERMRAASSRDQLRSIFTAAYKEASAAKDARAQATYIQVKDIRQKELQ